MNESNEGNYAEVELASRIRRFFASSIDAIIQLFLAIPFFIYSGQLEAISKGFKPDFDTAIVNGLFGFVVYLLLNGYFLKTYGQTVGKKLLSIRIASKEGSVPHVKQSIGLRFVPLYVCTLIPILNVLLVIDPLFIFRKDRKCLHDLVAGTQVVKA